MDFEDVPEKLKKSVQDVLATSEVDVTEGLRIAHVRTAHSKYMKMKQAQGVSKDKHGPSKGKKGGKGPKYMPKGRVSEGVLTELAAPKDGEGGDGKQHYKHGPVIDPTGDNHPDYNTYTANHNAHTGKFAKYNVKGGTHKGMWVVSHLHDAVNPKTGQRHRVMHMMTNDEKAAHAAFHKLDAITDSALLHRPGTLKYAPHQVKDVHPLQEGFISRKVKSLTKFVTGKGKEQQAQLTAKLQDKLAQQPAKIAAADDYVANLTARHRQIDLQNRLKAVQDPKKKREETKGIFGAVGGQYLSGHTSIHNNFRAIDRATARFGKGVSKLRKDTDRLNKAVDSMLATRKAKLDAVSKPLPPSKTKLKKPK